MEDLKIIELYWRRDEQAITETDRKYGPFCLRIAMNILSCFQDSEECVSDAYGKTWDTIPPTRPDSLRAYLGRIVRNLSLSRYRARHAQKRFAGMEVLLSELEDCLPAPDTVQRTADARELADLIGRWLRGCGEADRAVFVRRYWNGESVKELAGEAGMSPNAMTKRLLRLRESLRRYLEEEGIAV